MSGIDNAGTGRPQLDEQDAQGTTATLNATENLDPASPERRKKIPPDRQKDLLTKFKKKFKRWQDFEGGFIRQFNDDVRFAYGDSENLWQWDSTIVNARTDRPTLTVNMCRIHAALITNEMRRTPPSIMIKPTGLGATGESAKTIGGLTREIQRASSATQVYVRAGISMVHGGVGYWRVLTEWESDRSFNQVIRVRSIADATKAGLDTNAKEPDACDANWGFIYEDIPNDEIPDLYPEMEDEEGVGNTVIESSWGPLSWRMTDTTRVAEWYEREGFQDRLIGFIASDGTEMTEFASKMPSELLQKLLRDRHTRVRPVIRRRVMWYKIVGDKIVDHHEVPGEYIPIVRVAGEEVVVEGQLDRKGLVRNLKDPQRNLNYWVSSAAEQVALQGKSPYIGPKKAFENNPQWQNANLENYAYIPYNDWDEEANRAIAAPVRAQTPQMADAYIKGLQIAEQQLRDVSGQHENTEGKEDNAISGRAILARKQSGDVATYNFPDALAMGVAHTGRIIVSMLPTVYDTERMERITHPDGSQAEVQINPGMKTAQQTVPSETEENTEVTQLNPSIGTYDVEAESGPDFATQRQWAVEAMTTILGVNKDLWTIVGDLMVKNMDFPGADDMAARIRRTISPAVLGDGPTPSEQQLQQQIKQMQTMMQNLVDSLAQAQQKLDDKDEHMTVQAVDAETRRLTAIGNAQENFADAGLEKPFDKVARKTLADVSDDPNLSVQMDGKKAKDNQAVDGDDEAGEQPHPDARKAWVLDHPEHGPMVHVPEEGAQ